MEETAIDIRRLAGLLRRRARLILASVMLALGAAAGLVLALPPLYSATALVLVDPAERSLLDPQVQLSGNAADTARIDSEVEILRSDGVLLRVIAAEDLARHAGFGAAPDWRRDLMATLGLGAAEPTMREAVDAALARLRAAASIERRGQTYLIAIAVRTGAPELSARLANALASAYIAAQIEAKIAATLAARDIVVARVAELAADPGIETQRQHDALAARAEALATEADLQLADSRIVSPALAPSNPSFPDRTLALLLGGAGGLMLGLLLAVARETHIGGFTAEGQAEAVLRARLAVAVPLARGEAASPAERMLTEPHAPFAAAVRRLRAGRDRPGAGSGGRVVPVCSARPGEGRTTLALALARAFAEAGARTLLIECDLDAPDLARRAGIAAGKRAAPRTDPFGGAGPGELPLLAARDPLSDATLLVAAGTPGRSGERLLAGAAFARLVEAARASFDVVLLDTPAVEAGAEAPNAAALADGLVFVVAWADTPQQAAREALAGLLRGRGGQVETVVALNLAAEPKPYAVSRS